MKWLYKITGGRPMTLIGFAFFDCVSGEQVYYAADKFGREWLSNGRWSWFRIRRRDWERTVERL